jgi:hypothetical protein
MQRRLGPFFFILLSLLLVIGSGIAADAPPFAPQQPAGVRGQDPMDPHPATTDIPPLAADYTLTATIGDVGTNGRTHVDGTERVRLTNTGTQAVSSVTFDVLAAHYGWFVLDGGTIDGIPTTVDQAEIRFSFPEWPTLAPGDTRTVGFTFHLDIGDGGDGFDGTRRDGNILRLAYWFPVLSDDHGYHEEFDAIYTATGTFHVTLTAPAALTLASTGVVQQSATNAGQTTYSIEAPNVRDFAAFLSSTYTVTRGTTKDNVAVEVYMTPGHAATVSGGTDRILQYAIHAIEQMSAWVGPYPYPVFRVADAGTTMPGGIEFPMVIAISTRIRDQLTLVSHETAHQWFYGIIGTHPQTEPWVDEGAASFFEDAIPQGIDTAGDLSRRLPCAVSATVWEPGITAGNRYYCVYDGGRALYAAIRDTMGTDRFLTALHDLYAQHRYGIITARDLLTIFQLHSTTDLRPTYRIYLSYDWLDTLPDPGT